MRENFFAPCHRKENARSVQKTPRKRTRGQGLRRTPWMRRRPRQSDVHKYSRLFQLFKRRMRTTSGVLFQRIVLRAKWSGKQVQYAHGAFRKHHKARFCPRTGAGRTSLQRTSLHASVRTARRPSANHAGNKPQRLRVPLQRV